jgi:hypothetical protein
MANPDRLRHPAIQQVIVFGLCVSFMIDYRVRSTSEEFTFIGGR